MILQKQNSPRHVYLADDDIDDRYLFAEVLLELDRSIILTQAENGEQLMNLLSVPPHPLPDFIFLDLNMPIKNGYECLEEIRNGQGDLRKLRVIVLSTSSDPAAKNQAFKLGATLYAIKPTTFSDLKSLVKDVLAHDIHPHGCTQAASSTYLFPLPEATLCRKQRDGSRAGGHDVERK